MYISQIMDIQCTVEFNVIVVTNSYFRLLICSKISMDFFLDVSLLSVCYFNLFSFQAVQFLHESGVLLHYDDASLKLKDFYFIDPGWLCRMMAQIITVRQINPFISNDGVSGIHMLHAYVLFLL